MRGVSGYLIASTVKVISVQAMTTKKARSAKSMPSMPLIAPPSLKPAQGKALGDVVADKIDHQSTRNDGQHTRSGQHTPVDPRPTGARHDGGNRFGIHRGQRPAKQQFHPREHEAEERGDPDAAGDQRCENLDEKPRKR